MFGIEVNMVAVVVAAILNMSIGALWYSPWLFAKQWMAATNKTEKELDEIKKSSMVKAYAWSFVAALLTAYVLALFIGATGATTIANGIEIGFWLWLGFVATTSAAGVLYEQRPQGLYLLNNAYNLVAFIVMGALLAAWV